MITSLKTPSTDVTTSGLSRARSAPLTIASSKPASTENMNTGSFDGTVTTVVTTASTNDSEVNVSYRKQLTFTKG